LCGFLFIAGEVTEPIETFIVVLVSSDEEVEILFRDPVLGVMSISKLEEGFHSSLKLLSKNPHVGHKRPDLTDEPARFWPIRGQYLVIYLPDTEPLKIVRILHGARDASSQLQ